MGQEDADSGRPSILHCFADYGTESDVLAGFGRVVRIGIGATDTNDSEPVRADAERFPIQEGVEFDLGVFHPPCTMWADMTSISGDPDEHTNLIPEAREIASRYCADWIIENKPQAPLREPIVLDGRMFGLPIAYERAFETSFPVPQPPRHKRFDGSEKVETSPFFYSERSKAWWASVKGYRPEAYTKQHLAKNCIPAPYIHHLCRAWLKSYEAGTPAQANRTDYSDYDSRMELERRKDDNASLSDFE